LTSLLRAVRGLADDLLFPDAMRVDGLDVLPVAHLDALAALGLYGAPVPVQAGGLGLDLAAYCAVVEDLASGCLATTFVWLQHRGLVMTLAADGTPAALRDRWLGPACRGQVRGGIALGGLMPGPPRLRARPDRGGWRLDGDAPWVTGWGLIDLLLVVARGPDDSVVSLIVDAAAQWPSRPVRIINPYAPGGGVDTFTRPLAAKLTVALGLLLFFDRNWWLNVAVHRFFDAIGLGGQL